MAACAMYPAARRIQAGVIRISWREMWVAEIAMKEGRVARRESEGADSVESAVESLSATIGADTPIGKDETRYPSIV